MNITKKFNKVYINDIQVYLVVVHYPSRTFVTADRGYLQNPNLSRGGSDVTFDEICEYCEANNVEVCRQHYQSFIGEGCHALEEINYDEYDSFWLEG